MTELKKIEAETAKFMRGKYRLDEVGNGKDQIKFKQGVKTIVTLDIREDKYTFLIIFGKAEREQFEKYLHMFSPYIQSIYNNTRTYHDGKWMFIDVTTLKVLEEVKKLIMIKKKPNRKPFSKVNAVYGKCGHRCDLCVHYTDIAKDFSEMLIKHLNVVYGGPDWDMRCTGCDTPGCHCCCDGNELCEPLKCVHIKKLNTCTDCKEYPCEKATVGYRQLEPKSISADDVTWAILPYVPYQYEDI